MTFNKEYSRKWRKENAEKCKVYTNKYRRTHPEFRKKQAIKRKENQFYKETALKWRRSNPDKMKDYNLRAEYKITLVQFNEMLQKQNGLCAMCSRGLNKPCVDHNHLTGKIRGILCEQCNRRLGTIEKWLPVAVAYLVRFDEYNAILGYNIKRDR